MLFGSTRDMTPILQRYQNYAARVILLLPKSSNIHLRSRDGLPCKIACLCFHCHSSATPSYVADMLQIKPSHTRYSRSSSYTMPLPNGPAHSKATHGDRSFSFASSSVWHSSPNNVRCVALQSSSKSRLRTYLFRSAYNDYAFFLLLYICAWFWPCY